MAFTFHYRWRWPLTAEPDRLWPYLSDTDRIRAVSGFPQVHYEERVYPDGSVHLMGRFRMFGFPITWEEAPLEWVRNRDIRELTHYRGGPLGEFTMHMTIEPRSQNEGGGSWVTYETWTQPGNILGYPGVPIMIGLVFRRRFANAFRQIDQAVQNETLKPFKTRHTDLSMAGNERLRTSTARLIQAGQPGALVNRLVEYIRNEPDDRLTRIRPFALADRWRVDRYTMLALFLQATRAGLFDLQWETICPHCRGAESQVGSLREVSKQGRCPSCQIDFEVDFDHSIEATFRVNPSIRPVTHVDYCIASPQRTPHMILQQRLLPGETRTVTAQLSPGTYRWTALQIVHNLKQAEPATPSLTEFAGGQARIIVGSPGQWAESAATSGTITLDSDHLSVLPDSFQAGAVQFAFDNHTEQEQVISLSQAEWSDQACTAAEMTSFQAFRDLFASDVLRPGEAIAVENMSILFTDLKGSTALYRTIGDARAFRHVMDHFGVLRDSVAAHHGALVKTIGDAIMAVFTDPADAVASALAIQRDIADYNAGHPDQPLIVKLGIHRGACIAVTLNERLDYFGTVVNFAARLEGQSHGGDIVISEAVAADPGVNMLLQQEGVHIETFSATLRGFSEPFALRRLRLAQDVESNKRQDVSYTTDSNQASNAHPASGVSLTQATATPIH